MLSLHSSRKRQPAHAPTPERRESLRSQCPPRRRSDLRGAPLQGFPRRLPPPFRMHGHGPRHVPRPEAGRLSGAASIVDKKSQAERGRGSSLSVAEAATKRRRSRISSVWRSGYSETISGSVIPPARMRRTVATGVRRWRTHGIPPICAGSTVMRLKFFVVVWRLLSQLI